MAKKKQMEETIIEQEIVEEVAENTAEPADIFADEDHPVKKDKSTLISDLV